MTFIAGNGGFTLDGIPAKELNIIMGHDSERPMAPNTRDKRLVIDGLNGSLDFGSDVGDTYFGLVCNVITRNYRTLQAATERITSILLDGYGKPRTVKLIFDVNPDRYYLVKYSGSLVPARLFGFAQFTLPLITTGESFARSLTTSGSSIWGSKIKWGSKVRWGDTWDYKVTGAGSLTINNWGTMIVKPVIKLTGSFSNISITCGSNTLNYNAALSNDTLTIDCARMKIKQGNVNKIKHMTGKFIELAPGINEITISGTSLNVDVSFVFEAKYFN